MAVSNDLEFLLENLKQLLYCENPLICHNLLIRAERNQIQSLYHELLSLRTLLYHTDESLYEHEDGNLLRSKMEDVVSEADDLVDSFVYSAMVPDTEINDPAFGCPLKLGDVMNEIMSIKADMLAIHNTRVEQLLNEEPAASKMPYYCSKCVVAEEEVSVAFEKDELNILERLTGNQKQLDVISIVGMAGLGKTTLVRKVYNNPIVAYSFFICGWVTVSQVYQKRNFLVSLLNSFVSPTVADQIDEMNEQELCEKLFKSLKCYRYLIVMDDIWNARVWNDLQGLFPNDNNGSRVILTSRNKNMPGSHPYLLGFRTEDDSWDLLEKKVFGEHPCPPELARIGRQIAKKCRGLPLAIVVIAGLLRKRPASPFEWIKVAQSVSSHIIEDPKMLMNTLGLSYTRLPYHLKACFLYLGAFPEDYEIRVRQLIWLWVAEGFIRPKGGKSLEDTAKGCLMDLIDRNLVIVAQRSSNGEIKACCIHDLLRGLCSTKAKEVKFLQQVYRSELVSFTHKDRRLFIHSHLFMNISWNYSAPHVRSLLCFAFKHNLFQPANASFIYRAFKLLRVLDLKSTRVYFFPRKIVQLVHLKYLAVWAIVESLPSSISSLWNLETLIVKGLPSHSVLPYNIWKMTKLRHIYIEGEAIPCVTEPADNSSPFVLRNLQTISTVRLSSSNEEMLSRIPNIRKLGCIFSESGGRAFPTLDNLIHLDALKLYTRATSPPVNFPSSYMFPSNLKKLSLSRFSLPWSEISTLGKLPNLQVLKLLDNAFKGPQWDTSSGEFLQLKFLKFQGLDIEQWNASSDDFPRLQHLELLGCAKLEGIPCDFSYSCTLEMIKLDCSSPSVVESAMAIQDAKQSMEDYSLKIFIQDGLPLLVQSPLGPSPPPLPPLSTWPRSVPLSLPRPRQIAPWRGMINANFFENIVEALAARREKGSVISSNPLV